MAVQIEPGEHDWGSEDYVAHWISSSRPRDEQRVLMLRRMVGYIARPADSPIRVLDLGAGYGLVTQQVLELFPQATVVLHDFSEPMFEQARQRLSWAGSRISFIKADLLDPAWNSVFEERFDAVVSAIAIHNVRSPDRIRGIYREIFPLVKEGGCFLNYDRIPPPVLLASLYTHSQRVRTRAELTGEPATLENQLRWLREAGFDASDCLWKDMQVAILGGFRT